MIFLSQRIKGRFHFKGLIKVETTPISVLLRHCKTKLNIHIKNKALNLLLRGGKEHEFGGLGIRRLGVRIGPGALNVFQLLMPQKHKVQMAPACVLPSLQPKIDFIPNTNQDCNKITSTDLGKLEEDETNLKEKELNKAVNSKQHNPEMEGEDKVNLSSVNGLSSAEELETRLTRFWYFPKNAVTSSDERNEFRKPGEEYEFRSFRVMTFNALAQSLVDYKYRENDQTTMSWAKRRYEILHVVEEAKCDVVCLQEIDEMDYVNFFKAKVEELGYETVYKRKLQNRLDGILTMYKKDRYELVLKNELNFSSSVEDYDKPQVALIVALKDRYTTRSGDNAAQEDPDDVLLVANTHLIFNKSRGDIKLYQICNLLSGVKRAHNTVVEMMGKKEGKGSLEENDAQMLRPNVVVCGDFNLTPQSLLYNLLFEGFAPMRNTNPRCLSGQYLMFDQTYLTSSSGHNESGETLGNIKHYLTDVYHSKGDSYKEGSSLNNTNQPTTSSITKTVEKNGVENNTPTTETTNTQTHNNTKSEGTGNHLKELGQRPSNEGVEHAGPEWYLEVLNHVEKSDFMPRPEHVSEEAVEEFVKLLSVNHSNSEGAKDLAEELSAKMRLRSADPENSGRPVDADLGLIYCPFRLKSAYSADDGFNCEPAFTAFHGWQKGCVDYICYDPDHTALEGICEMPLYAQVKQSGDLPHRKWPASDHFSLISQLKRIK